jgi:hypothetical protein
MKKMNKSGFLSFTILLILVVMGIPVWNYFLGDGSLPSVNYLFFAFILFGVILLLLIFNLDKVVKVSNSLSKEAIPPAATVETEKEEIVTTSVAQIEVEEEVIPTPVAEIEVKEEIAPSEVVENTVMEDVPTELAENKEEEIVPTPIAEEKPKVEVKNTPTEKTAPTGNPKPYSPHYGSKRSGVWINEK